jgi:hypothetical protein
MRRLRMRNKFVLSVVLLFLATGLLWAQFWKTYSDKERQTVGEAYWLAGKQYQAVGKTEKGSEFMALARIIDPTLEPSAITDQALPSAAELLAQGKAVPIGAGAAFIPTGAINSFFLRFVGTLLDEDSAGVVDFLDGSIYLSKIPTEVTRADARPALDAFFQETSLKGLQPSAVYDLNSVVVARAPDAMQNAWGETYTLTVNAKTDYSTYVSFWDMKQEFYLHRVAGDWHIFALGSTPPPLSWRPQTAAPIQEPAPAVERDVDASKAITDAFDGFLAALLKKDADGALTYTSSSVRFLKLRQSVTQDELKASLEGYFEKADFGDAAPADVVDASSIFVEPAASPVEGVTGTVYMLNAMAKVDLSSTLPIWSMYQRYYFVKVGDAWKIFAIL